jgi:uncharacterized protein YwgA
MKRLQRESVIIEFADQLREHGSWCGETNIQKATYFLQTLFDPELDFDFILYRHGPFSFELRDELLSMRGDGLLKLEPANPYGPRIKPTQTGEQLKTTYPRTLGRRREAIAFLAERLGPKDVNQLERVATALYVTLDEPTASIAERAQEIIELKPHISEPRATAAVEEVDALVAEAEALRNAQV